MAVKPAIVIADVTIEADETRTPKPPTNETPAPAAAPPVTGMAIVAAAVAVQIEFAADTPASVIDSSDALTISNPPAAIVAAPAETAANALARVANDTGDTRTGTVTVAETQTEADDQTAPVTDATRGRPRRRRRDRSAVADGCGHDRHQHRDDRSSGKRSSGRAAPGKGRRRTRCGGEDAPSLPSRSKRRSRIRSSPAPKPGRPRPADEVRAVPEPQPPKPEARTDQRVETKDAVEPRAEKPAETEARPAQRSVPRAGGRIRVCTCQTRRDQ